MQPFGCLNRCCCYSCRRRCCCGLSFYRLANGNPYCYCKNGPKIMPSTNTSFGPIKRGCMSTAKPIIISLGPAGRKCLVPTVLFEGEKDKFFERRAQSDSSVEQGFETRRKNTHTTTHPHHTAASHSSADASLVAITSAASRHEVAWHIPISTSGQRVSSDGSSARYR